MQHDKHELPHKWLYRK